MPPPAGDVCCKQQTKMLKVKELKLAVLSERKIIDGELFEKMIWGGVANLRANLQEVNDLNVFPIPDGDTGENMYLTLQGGLDQLQANTGNTLSEKAQAMSQGMLLGARGNSGVILSQLFYGLAEGLAGLEKADVSQFGSALKMGVKCAYGAVAHPVEGTILTVAREAVENVCARMQDDTTVEHFFSEYLYEMKRSLEKTPDLLAVLKEAGVIDSGGAGLVYITEGFCKTLGGEMAENEIAIAESSSKKSVDLSKFNEDSEMVYGYCTEFLLQLQKSKTDVENFSLENLKTFLESVGDSVVAFKTGTVIKIHVHTMTPWVVMKECQNYGEFLTVKIENMTLQHNETLKPNKGLDVKKPKRARRKYALVTVATGEGLKNTFLEMGADYVIYGGQTNNPSSENFVEAFDEVNADHIFVLPNNGNVVLAAKQAAKIYTDSEIHVIETKTIGQGYSALSMLDYSAEDPEEIAAALYENCQETVTGMVAKSVRDTVLNGVTVVKDEYMGFTDHTMLVCSPKKTDALCALAEKLGVEQKEYFLVSYGKGVEEEEKEFFRSFVSEKFPQVELYEIDGGQEVYDFLLIIE